MEEERKHRTGSHVLKERETAETERRLWSSCRNCGMKPWTLAMQLKVSGGNVAATGRLFTTHFTHTHTNTQ